MKKKTLILLGLSVLLSFPKVVLSDCTDLGSATSSYAQGARTIIFYRQNTPIAQVDLQNCTVNPGSSIRLLKGYMCDSDSVIVDGEKCAIMTLRSTSAGSFELGH